MSTATLRLPQELVDHVIDHLYDDPAALRASSRVSRAWLPTSRYHLFRKVCLRHKETSFPSSRCRDLVALIDKAPEIAGYIRELEVWEGLSIQPGHPEVLCTTWVTSEPALLSLFKTLKNLRHLDISTSSTFYWRTLPPAFHNALCFLLATSSSLSYLKLHSWSFPNYTSLAILLSHCKSLRGLSLSSTAVGDEDRIEERLSCVIEERDGCDVIQSAKLDVLTLDYVTFYYLEYWLFGETPMVDVSSLRELRVSHFSDIHVVEKLLSAVSGSLEHLHLKPGEWQVRPMDLSHTTHLRSLRLTLEVPETAMEWVLSLLTGLKSSSACTIERIVLEFYVDVKILEGFRWNQLDGLLADADLSSLKHVEIGIFALRSHPCFVEVDNQLSGLKERAELRLYQLGLKKQRSKRQLSPRISQYET